jgi:hypothetical protein
VINSELTDTAYVLAALVVCGLAGVMAFSFLYIYGVVVGPMIDNIVYTVLDWTALLIF